MDDRRDKFDVRLLDLKEEFYKYTERENTTGSKAIRHFIKQGIKGGTGLTIEQQNRFIEELSSLRNQLSRVGGNLNQIARYFNQHDHLIESDLKKNLEEVRVIFFETNEELKELSKLLR